ncbi:hypothetical protein, partial [Streptomyces sp. SM14]|uniref:hypothetical protein n=1 Tax=Streptomyces sp. SM14 TaxID=1736045 RepID=UPI0015E17F8E
MKLTVAYFGKLYGGKRPPLEVIGIEDPRALYRSMALGPRMVMTLARYQPAPAWREPYHEIRFERMDHDGGKHSYQTVLKIDSFVAKLIR